MESNTDITRYRSRALFTFLRELSELRTKTVQTVDQYDEVLWMSDLPREPEVRCAAWDRGQDDANTEIWLEVQKPRIQSCPDPPTELQPWLDLSQLQDSSIEMPELPNETVVYVSRDGKDQVPEGRILSDHPDIVVLWEKFLEDRWWPWAESDRRVQPIQKVYTDLFSIYQRQQRLGEQYEVVFGQGLLTWKLPGEHSQKSVLRHLITAQTSIIFDSARGVITLGPAGEGAKLSLEQEMVDARYRPGPDELKALEDQLSDLGDEIWDAVNIDAILSSWVHAVSSEGTYLASLDRKDRASEVPRISLTPAVILRKRTDMSFVRAFKEIVEQIEKQDPIPNGVSQFVAIQEDEPNDIPSDTECTIQEKTHRSNRPQDMYFPLEYNQEQQIILERLSSHQGVLVQGPPGTGKSHTIVNLICHLLATGKKVLVTSHTARALRVLRRYIQDRVPDISPLAVVLLGDDRESLTAMEDSVQGITDKYHHWDHDRNDEEIEDFEKQLDRARREEMKIIKEIQAIRESEVYRHPRRFNRYEGTLQEIASQLREESPTYDWISDRPSEEPPLSITEFQELLNHLRDTRLREAESWTWEAVNLSAFPGPDVFSDLVRRYIASEEAYQTHEHIRQHPAYSALAVCSVESREALVTGLDILLQEADLIIRHIQKWTETAVLEILGDQDRVWKELYETTQRHLTALGDNVQWADETSIVWGESDRDHATIKTDAERLIEHLGNGKGWGIGPFRAAVVRERLYLRKEVRINGQPCDNVETLRLLLKWIDVETRLKVLKTNWAKITPIESDSFVSVYAKFHDLCEPLEAALKLYDHMDSLRSLIQTIPGMSEPTWHSLDQLRKLQKAASAVRSEDNRRKIIQELGSMCESVAEQITGTTDPTVKQLLESMKKRSTEIYEKLYHIIADHYAIQKSLKRRQALLDRLKPVAPELGTVLSNSYNDTSWDNRIEDLHNAWNWAQASAWIIKLSDPKTLETLRIRQDLNRKDNRKCLQKLASAMSWKHCFSSLTEHQRQHLVAWSKAMKNLGKGKGKYAAQHRRTAREHMVECRSAIPAWIMPLYRVADSIQPGKDLFDVVIVDEASQSGPEALLLTYLAKKLVVVGDDKQISPEFIGLNREDVNDLRARYIADLPLNEHYGVDNSFFALAEIRYRGRIRLREHFRCMPEIIQFSNELCYRSEPLIPLKQYGADRLTPTVSTQYVHDGYLKGRGRTTVNPPEAKTIVDEITRCCNDSAYTGKTFGVISLLSTSQQAQHIENLLMDSIGPEEMERRQLICGDPYAFQGDERDVIFLSLVSAPMEGQRIGTLTSSRDESRFNVAASRAREQMVLFHSATLNDLSKDCFRYKLLTYCTNPNVKQAEIGGIKLDELRSLAHNADRSQTPSPEPFDSWFEIDVCLRITNQGYRVLPQYEVAGYYIDLVIEGLKGRLAVECDGDTWHGPDAYERDMERQRKLERCGWTFWRVRGSAFALNPDRALESLWQTLQKHEIYPIGQEPITEAPIVSEVPYEATPQRHRDDHMPGLEDKTEKMVEEESMAGSPTLNTPIDSEAEESSIIYSQDDRPTYSKTSVFGHPNPETPKGTDANIKQLEIPSFNLGVVPYRTWEYSKVSDPTKVTQDVVIPHLVSIIEAEGPIILYEACLIFAHAAGKRMGKDIRSALNRAFARAIRQKLLTACDERKDGVFRNQIIRKTGTPQVVVRPRGPRKFINIPPSEVATVMIRLHEQYQQHPQEKMFRAVMDFYDTKRMTQNIQERLIWIEAHLSELTDS